MLMNDWSKNGNHFDGLTSDNYVLQENRELGLTLTGSVIRKIRHHVVDEFTLESVLFLLI
jgi:hypothetical protein